MFKTIYSTLLSLAFLCLLCSNTLKAQEEVTINITNSNCIEHCAVFTVTDYFSDIISFEWIFISSTGNSFSTTGIGFNTVEECFSDVDEINVYFNAYDDSGTLLYVGDTTYTFNTIHEMPITVQGVHETDCESNFFLNNSTIENTDCYDVCVGTTSTVTIENFYGILGFGNIIDIDPNNIQWEVFNGQNISTSSNPIDINGLTLDMDEVPAATGDQVCIPVRIYDFHDILGFQFSVNYDPNSLLYIGAQSFNGELPNWGISTVGYPSPGNLTLSWVDPIVEGITLPDDTILVEFCFEVIGTETTYLNFAGSPTTIEFLSADEIIIVPTFHTGAVVLDPLAGNTITVLWDEEGPGSIYFSGTYISSTGCESYYEYEFCFNVFPPPPAEIATLPPLNTNGILNVCEGQTIFFNSVTDDAEAYIWDFGDGNGAATQNTSHLFTNAGQYEVALITQADCDCADTTTILVFVEGNETPFIDCVATICEGTSSTYTANTNCDQYSWTISNNGTILEGGGLDDNFITIQWGAGPIGELTLETEGCPDLSECSSAAYMQIPIISANAPIDGPDKVCQGQRVIYSLPPFQGVEFDWQVSTFGTIISGQGTSSISVEWSDGPIPSQAQLVSVNYTNCYLECGGNASKTIFIRPEFYAQGAIEVCQYTNSDYTVTNTQTNIGFPAIFIVKDDAGNSVWTSPSPSASVNIDWSFAPGFYTIEISPQNTDDFCTTAYSTRVKVIGLSGAPTSIIGQTQICSGINYTYSVQNPQERERYEWLITNGDNETVRQGKSITVNWGNTPPYTLQLSQSTPPLFCASSSIALIIEPVNDFNITGDEAICFDQIGHYETDQTGDLFYEWSIVPPSAGTIIGDPTATNIDILWHSPGIAHVILAICGQEQNFEVDVHGSPVPIVNAPDAICSGTQINVTTLETYASYHWEKDGELYAANANPFLESGAYLLEVADEIGCSAAINFTINEYPESNIHISTPDFKSFCNIPPFTRLFADDSDDGYTYQWLQDGFSIQGATGTNYTATEFGNYQVQIIDNNNCTFNSNNIAVIENCGGGGGGGGSGSSCPNPNHSFSIQGDNDNCQRRTYTALADQSIQNSILWNFEDPNSNNNTASGMTVSHTYTEVGYYRVTMVATYPNGALCTYIYPDTVLAVADFSYNGVCEDTAIEFMDISTFMPELTNIVAWEWNFNDPGSGVENTSSTKNPVHTFSDAGIYHVGLTVTTSLGCRTRMTKTVIIYPKPTIGFDEPTALCANTVLAFSANTSNDISSLQWEFGDPTSMDANTSNLEHTYHAYDETATFIVDLEATNTQGCVNNFSRTIVTHSNQLNGEIAPYGYNEICDGDQITLEAPTNSVVQWQWTTGEQTPSITVSEIGNYGVIITDAIGCTHRPTDAIIDIIALPQSPIRAVDHNAFNQAENYTYDSLFVCQGEAVFLETEQQADYNFSWSNGAVGNSTEFSEERGSLLSTGIHTITTTVTDTQTGCSAVESFVIIVNPTPAIPIISTDNTVLCAQTTHTFTIENPNNNLDYFWSNGDNTHSITTDRAGTYHLIAMNAFGCRIESEEVEVLEGPNVNLVPSGCHARCTPDTICLPVIPGIVQYQWYQDGIAIAVPDGNQPQIIIEQGGVYTLEMQDEMGCVLTSAPLNIDILDGFGTIIGTVYFDQNGNQVIDPEDSVAPDILIDLQSNGLSILENDTDLSGIYGFANIPEANYILNLDTLSIPDGWQALITSVDTTFTGCDQEVFVDWLLVQNCFDTLFTTSVCPGDHFYFHGQDYAVGEEYALQIAGLNDCDSTFTFTVEENPSSFESLTEAFCPGETFTYNGQNYGGGTDTLFEFTNVFGCDSIIQLTVTEHEAAVVEITVEKSCPNIGNGSLSLSPISGNFPLQYALDNNNLQNTPVFENLAAASYNLNYEDANGCSYTESVTIGQTPPLIVELDDIVLPCGDDFIQLSPRILSGDDGQLQFLWSDGLQTQERPIDTYGLLDLEVFNGCEKQYLSIDILHDLDAKRPLIYVPNVFSPNNDGNNDVFKIEISGTARIESFKFQIFNRWGGLVFESDQENIGWKGDFLGGIVEEGVYVWLMEVRLDFCGDMIEIKDQGDVLVIR